MYSHTALIAFRCSFKFGFNLCFYVKGSDILVHKPCQAVYIGVSFPGPGNPEQFL